LKEEIEGFEVDEEEMNKVAEETGGANTDRSTKSNDEATQDEKDKNEECES
jgi:hypothetical protein